MEKHDWWRKWPFRNSILGKTWRVARQPSETLSVSLDPDNLHLHCFFSQDWQHCCIPFAQNRRGPTGFPMQMVHPFTNLEIKGSLLEGVKPCLSIDFWYAM